VNIRIETTSDNPNSIRPNIHFGLPDNPRSPKATTRNTGSWEIETAPADPTGRPFPVAQNADSEAVAIYPIRTRGKTSLRQREEISTARTMDKPSE